MTGKGKRLPLFPKEKKMFKYVCSDCHREYLTESLMYTCPECSKENDGKSFLKGILSVELDDETLSKAKAKEHVTKEDFYPFETKYSSYFPVGPTPLMRSEKLSQGLENVYFKLDNLLPSGSFKDRASYLVGELALKLGERKVVLASTGNAGAAMSAVGAALGLDVLLFVPESAPVNKLMQSILYKAHVIPVAGTYDDAFALSIEYTKRHGGINRNTAYNPFTIEGKKSVSIELFEDLGRDKPDVVYVPVGDGCIISGVIKGFMDLKRAGLIETLPEVVGVQSTGSDAIKRAFDFADYSSIVADTIADSISVDLPAAGRMAVSYVKKTGGRMISVTDDEIISAELELAGSGIFSEPASSAAYSGFVKDRERIEKKYGPGVKAVVLVTGTAFKDMKAFDGKVRMPDAMENDVSALDKIRF